MKCQLTLFTLLLSGLFLTTISYSQNSDFPGWRGSARDGKVTGFKAPATWPNQLNPVWEVPVGLGDASPVSVDGKIYLIVNQDSTETILALDAKTGKEIWKTTVNKAPTITGGAASHPGPRSTPYVYNGKIFTVGAGGIVACHDAKNGKLAWKSEAYTQEVPQFYTSASPLLMANLVILPLGGKTNGVVVAFDAGTGSEVWKISGPPCTYSSPILMDLGGPVIVHQSETALVGITLDGQYIGEIPTPGQTRFYNSSTPVIDGPDIYVAGAGTGTHKFRITTDNGVDFYEVWNNPKLGVTFNTPVLKDGFLYANEARFGNIFCLNAETGETAWSDTVKLNRFASMCDLGTTMMTLSGNAMLVFFKPDGNSYQELARYKVSETEVYAHPLVIQNRIFIKDKEKLTCWEVN
jgi:outer membrane protein assembly factor BamB